MLIVHVKEDSHVHHHYYYIHPDNPPPHQRMVDPTIRFSCHLVLSHSFCGHHPLPAHPFPALCHPGVPRHPHLGHLCGMGLPDMGGTRLRLFLSCNGKGAFFLMLTVTMYGVFAYWRAVTAFRIKRGNVERERYNAPHCQDTKKF